MALTYTPDPQIGEACPDFTLPATDGKTYSRSNFAGSDVCLVMFICNHCPYVKAIEDRLIELGRSYSDKSVKIAAISSNDVESYPADSFDEMKKKNYPFPYLYDESQSVARTFGAVCTPDFFLYDKDMKLAYRGRLDDSWKEPANVTQQELKAAIDALLKGAKPSPEQKPSMGCNIKWKK